MKFMEKIIDKMSQADWVMKVTLLAILMLCLHAEFISPAMGR
jgi:hypothetical protein